MHRIVRAALVVVAVLLCRSPLAAAEEIDLVVPSFAGPHAARLRRGIVDGLERHAAAQSEHRVAVVERVKERTGARSLRVPGARVQITVRGKTSRKKGKLSTTLTVTGPHDESVVLTASARSQRDLVRRVARHGEKILALAFEWVQPATSEEPAAEPVTPVAQPAAPASPAADLTAALATHPEAPADPAPAVETRADEPSSAAPPHRRARPARGSRSLVIGVSVEAALLRRTLTFNDDVFSALYEYELGAAAAAGLRAEVRLGRRIGLDARFRQTRTATSAFPVGELAVDVPTRHREFLVAATSGWQLRRSALFASIGYGESAFSFDTPADMTSPYFDVRYRYLRGGAGFEAALTSRLRVSLAAGWRHLLASGELEDARWFPRATAGVVDAELGLSVRIFGSTRLRVGAELTRYFFAMNPEPGDTSVAGGAVDQYLATTVGISHEWGGSP